MDSITQAALGAGIAGAVLGRHYGRKALLAGAVLGTLPDMDVIIRYADPLTKMISHRGFSHSVFVLTMVALLLWAVFAPRLCKPDGLSDPSPGKLRLFTAIWLALITHPLLDAFTAYGTQLFWPLKPVPASWSSIFIVDPFFTLPLLLAVLWAALRGRAHSRALYGTLIWCVVYLGLSLAAKHTVETRARAALQAAGYTVVETFSVPQPLSILLWRVVTKTDDGTYHESIHGLLDEQAGERLQHPLGEDLLSGMNLPADNPPLAGLQWFSGGWLRYEDINGQLVVSDLRMGMAAGHYNFRFAVAERESDAEPWRAMTPVQLRSVFAAYEGNIGRVLRRIWQPSPPLPLQEWSQHP